MSSLFITSVNCQLAYIWLNYHHFQCSQNTNNYFESVRHQYLCISSLIWTCISDANDYSHDAIFIDYFRGFIDGQNALQSQTIWNIHLKPNINIHILKFALLDNYWYCDYEYLKVYSSNKTTTYCGLRFPWEHDASDTKVKIILMTQRTGTKLYQLELLYCGEYIPNYQHFTIFTHSSSLINIHFPNTEQNAFESFHLISSNRLDIMELEAMNTCSKDQMVCHDGPGFKSPALQCTYNQSVWECLSSTFQMMCKFSRVDDVCTNGPRFYYCAIRATDHKVKNLHLMPINLKAIALTIDEAHSKGTSKYIYQPNTTLSTGGYLLIQKLFISFRHMFYEGNSCMYGGIYIVETVSSKDSEILSVCTPIKYKYKNRSKYKKSLSDVNNIYVVIIHYSEYSTEKLTVLAKYHNGLYNWYIHRELNQTYKENTLSITVPKVTNVTRLYTHSCLLKLRKIQYINISCDAVHDISCDAVLEIKFRAFLRTSCMNITIFYDSHASNIRGRHYDQITKSGHRSFDIERDFIQSFFIDMSACTLVSPLEWDIMIRIGDKYGMYKYGGYSKALMYNVTDFFYLPAGILNVDTRKRTVHGVAIGPHMSIWMMYCMLKPENVPAYAIWRVVAKLDDQVSHVSIEVLTDNHHSSSVYEWNDFRNLDGIYITVDKAVNILIESYEIHRFPISTNIWFMRHFMHDDKINKYIRPTGQAPGQRRFSFHNQR